MPATRRRLLWLLLIPVLLVAVVFLRGRRTPVRYLTASVDRGDIQEVVGATGVLQAVITVQVGSQVSGTISDLYADFNSRVKKGQVIARLEQSAFLARLNQAQANLASARANVQRSQAAIDDAKQKYDRATELAKQDLVPPTDLESARAAYQSALAQLQASKAAVKQADAAQHQAQVDLDHTVITAPVDGVVLARNVDVGQTVAASFQAPVLFVIANDLAHMQVNASIDEADIGRVRRGQDASFTVDAFPDQSFDGHVEQVRLQPVTNQNVVTYNTIISVENPRLRLMPGMTATVSVVVSKRENALRVPAAALRFRPEGFVEPRAGATAQAEGTASPRIARLDAAPGGFRGGAGDPGGAGGRTGSGRGQWRARMLGGPRAAGDAGDRPARHGRPGLVFVLGDDGRPQEETVKTGLSDGRFVEVADGLSEGARVVTGLQQDSGPTAAVASGTNNPFTFHRPQRRSR
jgi:HlyD family secretion protein